MPNTKIHTVLLLITFLFALPLHCYSQTKLPAQIPYGENEAVGKYADINGIKMYYEIYGIGEPLVLIHGNEGNIASLTHQIKHFSKNYKVVIADSRGHGKSELNTKKLSYDEMTKDWFSLISYLGLKKVNVFGWSDGGVIGLKLAINHPELISKLVTMGANTLPPESSAYPWAIKSVTTLKSRIDKMIADNDTSRDWNLSGQIMGLLFSDPNISKVQLESIKASVFVMAADKDVIIAEHTLSIFQNIKNAHLAIIPGQTHMVPETDPIMFNLMLEKFFNSPFRRPDTKDYFR